MCVCVCVCVIGCQVCQWGVLSAAICMLLDFTEADYRVKHSEKMAVLDKIQVCIDADVTTRWLWGGCDEHLNFLSGVLSLHGVSANELEKYSCLMMLLNRYRVREVRLYALGHKPHNTLACNDMVPILHVLLVQLPRLQHFLHGLFYNHLCRSDLWHLCMVITSINEHTLF